MTRVRIWDAPVRIFHWAIVLLMPALWWTAEKGMTEWHQRLGYIALILIVFRIAWGIFGSSTARFSSFVRGPGAVWRYARSLTSRKIGEATIGHNPMGGWSVVALIALLAVEVVLGLFSVDVDGINSGPFSDRVSFEAGRVAAHWHHLVFNGLLWLIALHVLAIGFYLVVRRENLIGPMLSGRRSLEEPVEGARRAPIWRLGLAILIAFAAATLAYKDFRF